MNDIIGQIKNLKGWQLSEDQKRIQKDIKCQDFMSALALVNQLGEVAEACGHHPDFSLGWGYVGISVTTHDAGGLTQRDVELAEKINKLL